MTVLVYICVCVRVDVRMQVCVCAFVAAPAWARKLALHSLTVGICTRMYMYFDPDSIDCLIKYATHEIVIKALLTDNRLVPRPLPLLLV